MKRKPRITGLQKFEDAFENTPWQDWPKGVQVFYKNPADELRYKLATKREFEAMGWDKENTELMFPSYEVDEVVKQCEAEELGGSVFLIIDELKEKLRVLHLALRLKFSKKRLRRINEVVREIEILLASLHKNQRLILLMTRVRNAPGYDKTKQQTKYYKLPLPFKRWRDTPVEGSEEELMLIPANGIQFNFSNSNTTRLCITSSYYWARSIPLWHLQKAG
ncbi:MAG: hypothetical protein GXC78_13110 [Chitinophagaceae bacterium]|jgi:hypothetical protein|nr:hypothetical protein [Chitinophagaceae bacterium]